MGAKKKLKAETGKADRSQSFLQELAEFKPCSALCALASFA
jgi:hypothetical protein